MDAFYAAVETRDNPELLGKPVIIGSLPGERGVVSTCNYKAREFGIRSAMPINQAYKLCPHGHFMYPNSKKYEIVSHQIHQIWADYTDVVEYIALDEGFLDVTASEKLFGGALNIAKAIKERTWKELKLTCSIGLGYSMSAAKIASEENKPNGYFEILTPKALRQLIGERSVRTVYTVGQKTAERLNRIGVHYVKDIYLHQERIINVLGNHGQAIVELAKGFDYREVNPKTTRKSIGSEQTFQHDVTDRNYLKDVLRIIVRKLSFEMQNKKKYAKTVTLKITYPKMVSITRSITSLATNDALEISGRVFKLFDETEVRPVRLVGITLSNFTDDKGVAPKEMTQLNLFHPVSKVDEKKNTDKLTEVLLKLQRDYGQGILKTGSELAAMKRISEKKET